MAKVRFTANFDYRPKPGVIQAYKAGPDVLTVRRECAEQAIAAGKAVNRDRRAPRAGKLDE